MSESEEDRDGQGTRNAEAAPELDDHQVKGQTQSPAPPDDVGVPSDEEMNEEGAADGE